MVHVHTKVDSCFHLVDTIIIWLLFIVIGSNQVRYAVTKDVAVTSSTYLQFYISMGCIYSGRCYGENNIITSAQNYHKIITSSESM